MKDTYKKTVKKYLSIGTILMTLTSAKKPESLSMKNVYGRWQVVETKDGKLSFEKNTEKRFMGRIIEIHPKYMIVDGVLYNDPEYRYEGAFDVDNPRVTDETKNWQSAIDKGQQAFLFALWLCNHQNFDQKHLDMFGTFVLHNDQLMSSWPVMILKRLPPRPWWQRAYSYLYAVLTPSRYNPEKIFPQQMLGAWEIVGTRDYLADQDLPLRYTKPGQVDELSQPFMGKKIILHPRYLVLDGVQYNNPHYGVDYDCERPYIELDEYNGYRFAGKRMFSADHFYINYQGDFCFKLGFMELICRKLPPPSFWDRAKYYVKYLLDIDASTKGYIEPFNAKTDANFSFK